MRYGTQHQRATAAGCRASKRSQATRSRVSLVIEAITRMGRTDLLVPHARDMGLTKTLEALAVGTDPATPLGEALRETLAQTPKALAVWVRRNRDFVSERIGAAEKELGGLPP